jgi:D-lactate dehydrogenase
MNLTPRNAGYFNYNVLKVVRPGTVFVNVARGEMSPADGLLRLLDEGTLGGVALDVYENERELAVLLRGDREPRDADGRAVRKLARRSDVILTPHNAFNAREAVERKALHSVEQVVCFLQTGRFKWAAPREESW